MKLCEFGLSLVAALLVALMPAFLAAPLLAQVQPPSQSLNITAKTASTWTGERGNIVQLEGPVAIELDRAKLSAQNAVVWFEESPGGQVGEELITIVLLGDARIEQPQLVRTGDRLIATARVNGPIRIDAENRQARDMSQSEVFRAASALQRDAQAPPPRAPSATAPSTQPDSGPATTLPARPRAIAYRARTIENILTDGRVAIVITGSVAISRHDDAGNYLEMQAERAVIFTTFATMREAMDLQGEPRTETYLRSAYLEGDVRVSLTPADHNQGEQRLEANRVYYEFATDRAVLTDAVLRAADVQRQIPLVVRARTVKQLSEGEYRAHGAELSMSSFAIPSYSIRADKAYVRQDDTGDSRYGTRTTFNGRDVTFNGYGVPVFWLPAVGGSLTERGFPLRELRIGNSKNFGFSVESEWGLLETLGYLPPADLDISFRADYFSDRGPAGGIDADYGGGFVSDTTAQPWNFQGDFRSYFVYDEGEDVLGRRRAHVEPGNDVRGRIDWEHQHFFHDDWQLQLRAGWVSDATFLEEWFENDFNNGLPLETSIYLKRQRETEAMTFLATVQPNNIVTTSDLAQEQFEIERLPQLGYHRVGDSLIDDRFTFFSDNTLERVRFNVSGTDIVGQGYVPSRSILPGQPSLGVVGAAGVPAVDEDYTDRFAMRQELDYPFALGQFKVVPYVMGRYAFYSDSPDGSTTNRLFAGAGVRFNTQFWRLFNKAESDLFDVHRVRHIIEPEVHLFTSAQSADPNDVWIYDEPVDRVYDVSAVQVALRQRWQTKRGAPGRWRSVDFLTLNIEANFFANQPSDVDLAPVGFRGVFFTSMPEVSIPRNSVNADLMWRISDTTVALADVNYNADEVNLATASVGLIAARGERMTYFVGFRYIEELNSSIATVAASYQMTRKYTLGTRQSYDFGDNAGVYSSLSFLRKFDRFFVMVNLYHDDRDGESGISFGLYPEGLGGGASTDQLTRAFGGTR